MGDDGKAVTSAACVSVDVEDADAFRKAVKREYGDSHLAGVAASDLTVLDASGVALEVDSGIAYFEDGHACRAIAAASCCCERDSGDDENGKANRRAARAGCADEAEAIRPFGNELNLGRGASAGPECPSEGGALGSILYWRPNSGRSLHQREQYRTYVEANIGDVLARKKLCVLGVEKGKNILSATVAGHDIDLVGLTDMLVLSDLAQKFPPHLDLLPEVKMLMEVKEKVIGGSYFQELSELIALDVLVDDPVMALLTDSAGHWQFFWVSERSKTHIIIRTVVITDPSEAFAVIRTLLEQPPSSDVDLIFPCFEEPVKRPKLAQLLLSVSEGGGSSDIREVIERYCDIASVLGLDFDMARAAASQIVRTLPSFSFYT